MAGDGKKRRIHLCDVVTVHDGHCPSNTFMQVSGARDIGKYEEFEGMWDVQEINGKEPKQSYRTFGKFMTVWKPIAPPKT